MRDARPRIRRKCLEHLGHIFIGRARRSRALVDPPARTSQRQPFTKHQLLDLQHLVDIRLPIQSRAFNRFLDANPRELFFPRSQYIRLQLGQLADLSGFVPLLRHAVTSIAVNSNKFRGFRRFRGVQKVQGFSRGANLVSLANLSNFLNPSNGDPLNPLHLLPPPSPFASPARESESASP